jgi:acyl dehydratase
MTKPSLSIENLQTLIKKEIGLSEWHTIEQQRINDFADTTEDHQFIHVDPARAAATPFGGTIAHGFLSLSLLSVMFAEAIGSISGVEMSMNYGFDSVRFLSPVPCGSRVRGRFWAASCVRRSPQQWKLTVQVSMEIENIEKPAMVAEWVVLLFEKA